jgi:hypothetical protein
MVDLSFEEEFALKTCYMYHQPKVVALLNRILALELAGYISSRDVKKN